jgi:beta-glucosidase
MSERGFPDAFLWGVAGAGHQVEGDNVTSDTWYAEHVTPTVFREPSGAACRGYEQWREDLDLVAAMGLSAYRFSVEWARVEPVEGELDTGALDHYEALVDRCVQVGLAPVVTFNHFTAPHWFAARGGWLDPAAPQAFARYCDVVMDRFGDRIALAITMNEPNISRLLTWLDLPDFVRDLERATLEAASAAAGVPRYRLANVIVPEELDAMVSGPRSTSRGSSWPATTTSSESRTTSASTTTATEHCPRPRDGHATRWAQPSSRCRSPARSATPTRSAAYPSS